MQNTEEPDFNAIVDRRISSIVAVLCSKAKEYASEQSRFHNFEVAAVIADTTPEEALAGMMAKHFVSVLDIINNPENVPKALVDEKIGDLINYLILLEGLLAKRRIKERCK